MAEPSKAGVDRLLGMVQRSRQTAQLSDADLHRAGIALWGEYALDSHEAAVLSELLDRFADARGLPRDGGDRG